MNYSLLKPILLIAILVAIKGCKPDPLIPEDYKAFIENSDNGLKDLKIIGDYEITLFYKPIDYLISTELLGGIIDSNEWDNRVKELEGMEYFTLRIASKDKSNRVLDIGNINESDYYKKLDYFGYAVQSDIHLINSNDSIDCALHHFVRTYDLAPHIDILLAFPKVGVNKSDIDVIYDARPLGIGILKFNIARRSINTLPELITS